MTDRDTHTPPPRFATVSAWIAGGSFLGFAILLSVLSTLLHAGAISREHSLIWLAGGGTVAGALYLAGLYRAKARNIQIAPLWIAVVAVLARLLVVAAPPMLESDYQRYLWDGAVAASGINPYKHAPNDVIAGTLQDADAKRLADLARRAGPVLTSINHPDLTTIYPPVAQAAFSAAYTILPFSPGGLRVLFLMADAATVLLLAELLRALALPAGRLVWFAWNPLLLREVYSSLHMDILLLPLIAGGVLAALRARGGFATAWFVVASAVKVWPIVLAPLVLRSMFGQWRRLAVTLGTCGLLGGVLWLPVLLAPHTKTSGFLAYGRGWQNNDGFFRAGIWLTERVLNLLRIEPWHSHTIMRLTSAALLGGVLLWKLRTRPSDGASFVCRCFFIVGAIFLLSPTQFPWYWLWCLPFLTLRPSLPLLLYTALLPLYYVQDRLVYPLSHWLQHMPVWTLLAVDGARTLLGLRARSVRQMEVTRA